MTTRAIYHSASYDSERWSHFTPRDGDIVVCAAPKCGTTWLQTIIASLLWPDGDAPGPVTLISPWLEGELEPIAAVTARLTAQTHRRFIKTHTPPNALPMEPGTSYVVVFRDGRDAFMSLMNHIAHFRSDTRLELDRRAMDKGVPKMRFASWANDPHQFFDFWVAHAPPVCYLGAWWPLRCEKNVRLLHFNDLVADLATEMSYIAEFLGLRIQDHQWPKVVDRCGFSAMRSRPDEIGPFAQAFVGGIESLLYKGTNGRWRDVLSAEELRRYDTHVADCLPRDAADWLEQGSIRTGRRPSGDCIEGH